MNRRKWLLLTVLALLVLTLVGCQRDRPAPTPFVSPLAPVSTPLPTSPLPSPGVSTVLPAGSPRPDTTTLAPTPLRLATPSPTAPVPKPAATVALPQEATPPPSTSYFTYKVVEGDTLSGIAGRFGVSTQAILALNSLADASMLPVGQELKIPGEPPPGYGGTQTYVVRAGDTLSRIAQRFGVTVRELQELNNIANPDQIVAGQRLLIPVRAAGTVAPATTPRPRTYVVQRGDTLNSIAARFGVTARALATANNITNPDAIYVGQVLTIP